MRMLSLQEIWEAVTADRKKFILVVVLVVLILSPAGYFLIPARYQAESEITIPFGDVELESLRINVRREIVPQLHRELNLDSYGITLSQTDRYFSMLWHQRVDLVDLFFTATDPELAALFLQRVSLETLSLARNMQIDFLIEEIETKEAKIVEIDEIFNDQFIVDYYTKQYENWSALLKQGSESNLYVFLEVDPYLTDVYKDKKNLQSQVRRHQRSVSRLENLEDEDLAKNIAPVYQPESKPALRLLLMVVLSAMLGFTAGLLVVLVKRFVFSNQNQTGQKSGS